MNQQNNKYRFFLPSRKPGLFSLTFIGSVALIGTITFPIFLYHSYYAFFIALDPTTAVVYFICFVVSLSMGLLWFIFKEYFKQRLHPEKYFIAFSKDEFIFKINKYGYTIPIDDIISMENKFRPRSGIFVQINYREGNKEKTQYFWPANFSFIEDKSPSELVISAFEKIKKEREKALK